MATFATKQKTKMWSGPLLLLLKEKDTTWKVKDWGTFGQSYQLLQFQNKIMDFGMKKI